MTDIQEKIQSEKENLNFFYELLKSLIVIPNYENL